MLFPHFELLIIILQVITTRADQLKETPFEPLNNQRTLVSNYPEVPIWGQLIVPTYSQNFFEERDSSMSSPNHEKIPSMLLRISTDETIICEWSPSYHVPCDPSVCIESNLTSAFKNFEDHRTLSLPRSSYKDISLSNSVSISLGDGRWQLKSSAFYLHNSRNNPRQSCGVFLGPDSLGIIGLGLGGEARKNFQDANPIFSINAYKELQFNVDPRPATLIFGFNSSYADTSVPPVILPSDANWVLQVATISFGKEIYLYNSSSEPLDLFFDFEDVICLPGEILQNILDQLDKNNKVSCSSSNYDFQCLSTDMSKDMNDLPSLVFGLADGTTYEIEPTRYMHLHPKGYYVSVPFVALPVNAIHIGIACLKYYSVFQQVAEDRYMISLYNSAGIFDPGYDFISFLNASISPKNAEPSPNAPNPQNVGDQKVQKVESSPEIASSQNAGGLKEQETHKFQESSTSQILTIIIIGIFAVVGCTIFGCLRSKKGWFGRMRNGQTAEQEIEVRSLRNYESDDI